MQGLCVPLILKRAVITQIFEKKDDILDPLNYRTYSITTLISKILEKCLHKEITANAENRGIHTPQVFAQDAILYSIETIQHEIDIGRIVHAVLLDLSKAFDSLSHQILLKKLQSLHFSPSAIQIVEFFKTGRLQQVSVNNVQSEWVELKQGVPQGTVEGPLFLNLCVNDLPELMSETAHVLQYADGCFCSGKKSETALEVFQETLCKLAYFFRLNKLNLNANKTEFIAFSLKNDKRLDDLETVIVGSTIVKKSDISNN